MSGGIASADNSGPDWFQVAKGLATAIMWQRTMRGEHTVGRDGRSKMGMVDLFGCYAVDTAAREFCELSGLPFGEVEAPNEHQAFFMAVTGRDWSEWFTDRANIVAQAGKSPGRGKVNMKAVAQGIAARSDETLQAGSGESLATDNPTDGGLSDGCARMNWPASMRKSTCARYLDISEASRSSADTGWGGS